MRLPPPPPGARPPSAPTIRVLVADPHPVCREGLKAVVAAHPCLLVVGEAATGPAAAALAGTLDPDVVVLDGSLAAGAAAEGLGLGRRVLVLIADGEDARGLDAAGWVPKWAPAAEVVAAVRAVAAGNSYRPRVPAAGPADLSAREEQVLRLIAVGYGNKEIAARMDLSVKTVETYKARATEKLGLRSRVELMRWAVRRGWLTDAGLAEPVVVPRGA